MTLGKPFLPLLSPSALFLLYFLLFFPVIRILQTSHKMGRNLLRSLLGLMKSSSWKKASNRIASTVSLEAKKKQSSRIEEFSRGKGQLNASETCTSFKRSGRREITGGRNITKKVKIGSSSKTEEAIPRCHSKGKQLPSSKMKGGDAEAKQEDKDKNIKSHFTHVHPKLPDYDDLVAKFKQLKKEKMMSLESKQFEL